MPPRAPTMTGGFRRREATETEAARHDIPAGYSLKRWDPTEAPVILLGSVFDAHSLGQWIYEWTVCYYGREEFRMEIAGDLWLLLIRLAGKLKRADHNRAHHERSYTRRQNRRAKAIRVAGDILWRDFKKLVATCGGYMWIWTGRDRKASGCEFVRAMFGRDKRLHKTMELMRKIHAWNLQYDTIHGDSGAGQVTRRV